ncbi:Fe-S cluster assembly protein NifU [Desulfovibrio ferrophilus]|uniref:Nitrogen fixation protein NifU n=1 Tax=Desulfovibrio ferrophilus TaxID=241368 RepID=A0A2Z6B345_9BACT|nr:Fe-S cluster assembly protein NifU [Desulfovibrio ferrophilus]BBD09954.1 nitrogen fixation protein NifU [Desulfovibrio ferrophilus]
MWEYTDKVRELFLNPKNAGEIPDANAVGEVGSLACGDALKLFLKIDDDGVIEDAKFQTFGCASAIASSSALTEMLKGMPVEDAEKITNKEIAAYLGGLPKEKMHCSVMGQEALEACLLDYRGEEAPEKITEGEIVCHCFGVTDVAIRRAVEENGITTLEDITNFTKAGGGCGDCHEKLEEILFDVLGKKREVKVEAKPLTNIQRMQKVMQVIDEVIRPSLKQDGGDIELVDLDGTDVIVSLRGACGSCPSAKLTLNDFVQKTLREQVEPDIRVREASS